MRGGEHSIGAEIKSRLIFEILSTNDHLRIDHGGTRVIGRRQRRFWEFPVSNKTHPFRALTLREALWKLRPTNLSKKRLRGRSP